MWQEDGSEQSLRDAATRWNDTITPEILGRNTCTAPKTVPNVTFLHGGTL